MRESEELCKNRGRQVAREYLHFMEKTLGSVQRIYSEREWERLCEATKLFH